MRFFVRVRAPEVILWALVRAFALVLVPLALGTGFAGTAYAVDVLYSDVFALPAPMSAYGLADIASAPDGTLWVTFYSGGKYIGHIMPDGTILTYPLPTALWGADSVAVGTDSLPRFLSGGTFGGIVVPPAVGTLHLDGTTDIQPLPGYGPYQSYYSDLAIGADNTLWLNLFNGLDTAGQNGIRRISPDGTVTDFTIAEGLGGPNFLATGPDHSLWFTQWYDKGTWSGVEGRIGRIAEDGTLTEYEPAFLRSEGDLARGETCGITRGADSTMWFTQCSAYAWSLSSITNEGTITRYSDSVTGKSGKPVKGPDDSIWFAVGPNHDRLGRMQPDRTYREYEVAQDICSDLAFDGEGMLWYGACTAVIVRVDPNRMAGNHAPVLTLLGANPMSVVQGAVFEDPGATAYDEEDGDLTSSVDRTDIDTSVTGTTTVTYSVTDSGGLAAVPVSREVVVVAPQVAWGREVRVAMVLAEPSDTPHKADQIAATLCDATGERVQKTYIGHSRAYFEDLGHCITDYYRENSYGAVRLTFDVFDNNGAWYKAPGTYAGYVGEAEGPREQFIRDVHTAFTGAGNSTNNHDLLLVVHAGQSYVSDGALIRAAAWSSANSPIAVPPYVLLNGEGENLGQFAHEIGHALGNVLTPENTMTPDMYKTDSNYVSNDVGSWDLMARGSVHAYAQSPMHMSSYIKEFLGWLTYSDHGPEQYGTFSIGALETKLLGSHVFRYNVDSGGDRYYIAEARNKNLGKYGTTLPSGTDSALLLYYVDTHGKPTYGYSEGEGTKPMLHLSRTINLPAVLTSATTSYPDYDYLVQFTFEGGSENLNASPKVYTAQLAVTALPSLPERVWGAVLRPLSNSPLWQRLRASDTGAAGIPPVEPIEYKEPWGRRTIIWDPQYLPMEHFKQEHWQEYPVTMSIALLLYVLVFALPLVLLSRVGFAREQDERVRRRKLWIVRGILILIEIVLVVSYIVFAVYADRVRKDFYERAGGAQIPSEQPASVYPDLDLHAITPDGRHIGMNYDTGEYENQIAESITSGDMDGIHEWIYVPATEQVRYYVSAHDTEEFFEANPELAAEITDKTDAYELYARVIDPETGIFTGETLVDQPIQPGEEVAYSVTVPAGTTTPTLAPPDTTAPTTPAQPSSTSSTSTVTLTWPASTDEESGVAYYTVYRNGTAVGTTTALTYMDTGLAPSTTYSYTVSATDNAGNESAQSPARSAYTKAIPKSVSISSSASSVPAGTSATLTWNVSGYTSCTKSGGWSGVLTEFAGSLSVTPTTTTTYKLTCSAGGSTGSASATIEVGSGGSGGGWPWF